MKKVWGIALIFIIIDQWSKIYVKLHFEYADFYKVFNWFYIRFIENPGMAYGVEFGGYTGKVLLTIVRMVLITGGIIYLHRVVKPRKNLYLQIPVALLLAGALGNLIDSMFYGLMFDKGLIYMPENKAFTSAFYDGLAHLNFEGYSGFLGGCVVDMLHFPIIDTVWPEWVPFVGGKEFKFFNPIFNVADACITTGIIILYLFRNKAFPEGFPKRKSTEE